MDWSGKIIKIENLLDRVDFWVSLNASKTSTFIISLPALEASKTIQQLAEWAYGEYLKRKPAEPEPTEG